MRSPSKSNNFSDVQQNYLWIYRQGLWTHYREGIGAEVTTLWAATCFSIIYPSFVKEYPVMTKAIELCFQFARFYSKPSQEITVSSGTILRQNYQITQSAFGFLAKMFGYVSRVYQLLLQETFPDIITGTRLAFRGE